jgi:membrane-associated phospholipid phosphatase
VPPRPTDVRGRTEPAELRYRRIRWLAAAGYAVAFAVSVAVYGVPLFRVSVVVWTLGAFGVHCIGRGWRLFGRALLDWVPFCAVMICYDLSRGAADRFGQPVHVTWPAAADRWLFGAVPTVWLQERLHRPGAVHWYDILASLTYFSFFLAVPVVMAVLWIRNRPLWRLFTANVVAVSLAALVTYVVFPEAPPWYAAREGAIGSVARISSLGWSDLGLRAASDLITQGQALSNDVAAMPSLHVAYTMLVALFFLRRVPRWGRPLLLAYPVAMGLTLVYTGEHYVVDVVAGIGYVVLVDAAVSAVASAAATRRAGRARAHPVQPVGAVAAVMSASRVR